MGRAVILVMDSFGIGATADAVRFGDAGANHRRYARFFLELGSPAP